MRDLKASIAEQYVIHAEYEELTRRNAHTMQMARMEFRGWRGSIILINTQAGKKGGTRKKIHRNA